ncbi:hypothetical protein LCGC14_2903400, partial [marine sediment metagenome]
MTEKKYVLSSIVGVIILLSIGAFTLYTSDFKYIFQEFPDNDIFILEYDSGNKIEIMTRSSVCPYALFRVTKDGFTAKCGWRKVLDAKWYLEYYKTYGEDEWVRLNRKPSKITLDIEPTLDGFIIKKVTPYYATKSRSGTAGNLIETYKVTQDSVKSSLEFDTKYTSRKWRVIWRTDPNVEVVEDLPEFMKLDKQLNIFFADDLFQERNNNFAYYKVQEGSFKIDPLIQFGNLSGSGGTESFHYGYCDDNCNNEGNVSFKPDSASF